MNRNKAQRPEETAEEKARGVYQRRELDRETAENERKLKALSRDKLGSKSLLGNPGAKTKKASKAKSVYGNNPRKVKGKGMMSTAVKAAVKSGIVK